MTSLADLTYDTVDNFSLGTERQPAKLLDCFDADTIKIAVMVGDKPCKFTFRLSSIVTCERNAKGADRNRVGLERTVAYRARARVLYLVTKLDKFKDGTKTYSNQDVREACSACKNLIEVECKGFDKYGRVLGNVYIGDTCLNELLLEEGFAKRYSGGRREVWTIDTLEAILEKTKSN